MKITIEMFVALFFLTSCLAQSKSNTASTVYTSCSLELESSGVCQRFMERHIYFVNNSTSKTWVDENGNSVVGYSNHPVDILKVQDAIKEFAGMTELGDNYFVFHYDNESNLKPLTEFTSGTNFKSFIQIINDYDFNEIYQNAYSSKLNPLEQNAIVITNPNNRRQFYILLRASCFSESDNNQCIKVIPPFTYDKGGVALIARNFARLVGVPLVTCDSEPYFSANKNKVMCGTFPSNFQWSYSEQNRFVGQINNALEMITLNSDYYTQTFLEDI